MATTKNSEPKLNISIVGGGLVGSLAALHLGKRGHEVHLYEYREDIRTSQLLIGRSINLALSERGRKALAEVGLEEKMLQHGIPMYGRMLHDLKGNRTIVPYDSRTNKAIFSVGRKFLNEILLNGWYFDNEVLQNMCNLNSILTKYQITFGNGNHQTYDDNIFVYLISAAEDYPNIHLYFNKKMTAGRIETGQIVMKDTQTNVEETVTSDMVIGADGAFSVVRRQMAQRWGFNFSQTYIEHGYLELCIPPGPDGEFLMPHNYLHIWPRNKFMMIALPNQDRTWTVTLFMPFENFEALKTPELLIEFFKEYFPDSIPLIGQERLIEDFFKTKPQYLVAVKCRPYHVGTKALIIGDAAHAVVPFYGQGMNAGFEDCSLLTKLFNEYGSENAEKILTEFSDQRWEDAHAICDLAMYNYIEMRDLVTKRSYIFRKKLDDFLFKLMPNTWVPLYNSVSFSHMPYKKCIENRAWQDRLLTKMLYAFGIGMAVGVGFGAYKLSTQYSWSWSGLYENIEQLFKPISSA